MVLPRVPTVVAHVISWLLFFSLIISFDSLSSHDEITFTKFFSIPYLLFYATYIFIFYLNLKVLVPLLYLQRRYVLYLACIALLLLGVYLTQPFDHIYNRNRSADAYRSEPRFDDRPPPPMGDGTTATRKQTAGRSSPRTATIRSTSTL